MTMMVMLVVMMVMMMTEMLTMILIKPAINQAPTYLLQSCQVMIDLLQISVQRFGVGTKSSVSSRPDADRTTPTPLATILPMMRQNVCQKKFFPCPLSSIADFTASTFTVSLHVA